MKKGSLLLAMMLLWSLWACTPMPVQQEKKPSAVSGREFDLPIPDYTKMELKEQMRRFGFALGAKVYVRIIKEEHVLELWMLKADEKYHLYQKFPICVYSGDLGPKTRQGDKQSPEGFYQVTASQMKPDSRFHLAFNIGFPNAYDRAHGYTGSYLMVHGNCVSIGCYAMGDSQIEVIYSIVSAAQQRGQYAVPVHIYPFRMTQENLLAHRENPWLAFWLQLKPGWDYFESMQVPPKVTVEAGQYVIGDQVGVDSQGVYDAQAEKNVLSNLLAQKALPFVSTSKTTNVLLKSANTPHTVIPSAPFVEKEEEVVDAIKENYPVSTVLPVSPPKTVKGPIAVPVSSNGAQLAQPESLQLLSEP